MSGGFAERLLPPDRATMKGSAVPTAGDRLAALLGGPGRPAAHDADDLLRAWRDAQREATDRYASWREVALGGGYPAYLAALDREERTAEIYADVRRRALAWSR